MPKIKIKPLSVNGAWQGRRFKTPEYEAYEQECLYKLPKLIVPSDKHLSLCMKVGLSNVQSDLSNSLKCFEDILQKKYDFNDRNIYKIIMLRDVVEKGGEYIDFNIGLFNI